MTYPYTPPIGTQSDAVIAITEAEAAIGQCMANYYCNTILPLIGAEEVEVQAGLYKTLMCSMSVKEKAMADVINALANKILADKGIVPGGNDGDFCDC